MPSSNASPKPRDGLSQSELFLFSIASAVITANAYYIHPIIARVAESFDVSATTIGAVPALNQLALAAGIFFLLPLGDRFSNKQLVTLFVGGQCLAIVGMALAQSYTTFVAASTLLGLVTIAPYLLPAYVSKRVPPERLGHATALLTTGIIIGILLARAGAGFFAEHFGWRTVYYIASLLMFVVAFTLPMTMKERTKVQEPPSRMPYFQLIGSLLPVALRYPDVILSGCIQALSFGVFLAIWLGLGLHLTSPEMGYGVDVVGYLAIFSITNLFTTPYLGSWADKLGAQKTRLIMSAFQFVGVCLLGLVGHNLWLLLIPILFTNIAGPVIDITGRMTFLTESPEIRTRLMTVYIVLMFSGAGLGSWAGTAAYDIAKWQGSVWLAITLSAAVLCLSALATHNERIKRQEKANGSRHML